MDNIETIRAPIFLRLSRSRQKKLAKSLSEEELLLLLNALDPDDATDVLRIFDKTKQKKLVAELSEEIQEEVSTLLKFDKKTAAGLMTLDYIQVESDKRIEDVAKKFAVHEKRTGRPPEILVTSEGKLVGHIPGYQLGFAKPRDKVIDFTKKVITINFNANFEEVFQIFHEHPHSKVIVLDEHKNAIGIIYSDDVLALYRNQKDSLYGFAGVHEEEEVNDSAFVKVNFRYKWLIINLATAFLASFVVSLFDETINKNVLLAVYMPIVAGMGGNAGTQTLAIMVRGIALRQINHKNFMNPLISEILAGFVNGLINAVLVFGIVMLFNRDFKVALVLSIAMIANLVVAATFGTLVPLAMKFFGKDPATSATIFITTATDVLGFLAFLELATIVL